MPAATRNSHPRPDALAIALLVIAILLDMAIVGSALGGDDAFAAPVRAPATCGCSFPLS